MMLSTIIGRIPDGLPLAATMQEDDQIGTHYQNQAKLLLRKMSPQSPPQCSIETGPYIFHCLIDNNICYLALCDQKYSKRLAFAFLDDLAQEFYSQYKHRVASVSRPYSFIEFDNYVQKAKKNYTDSRVRRNMDSLNNELQDVQRIMVRNIDDVIQRGTLLSDLDNKAQSLSILSQKYKKDAKYLNTKSFFMKAAVGTFVVVVLLYYWIF